MASGHTLRNRSKKWPSIDAWSPISRCPHNGGRMKPELGRTGPNFGQLRPDVGRCFCQHQPSLAEFGRPMRGHWSEVPPGTNFPPILAQIRSLRPEAKAEESILEPTCEYSIDASAMLPQGMSMLVDLILHCAKQLPCIAMWVGIYQIDTTGGGFGRTCPNPDRRCAKIGRHRTNRDRHRVKPGRIWSIIQPNPPKLARFRSSNLAGQRADIAQFREGANSCALEEGCERGQLACQPPPQ